MSEVVVNAKIVKPRKANESLSDSMQLFKSQLFCVFDQICIANSAKTVRMGKVERSTTQSFSEVI
jgi:hypothetical protein